MRGFIMKIINVLLVLIIASSAKAETPFESMQKNFSNVLTIQKQGVERRWQLKPSQQKALLAANVGDELEITDFPLVIVTDVESQKNQEQTIKLTRYEIMAPGAKVRVIDESGIRYIAPSELKTFSDPANGIGMVLNARTGDVEGVISSDGVRMYITGNLDTGLDFRIDDINKSEMKFDAQCHTELGKQPQSIIDKLNLNSKSKSLVLPNKGATSYETVIAVDTDTEWMDTKSDNTTTAMNYINTMFMSMNVFFERDLSLRLLIGNVTLRINTDPYPTESNIVAALTDFGEEWRTNQDSIQRDFALLLSAQNIGNFGFSGIAWLDVYCENGFLQNGGTETVGGYSVNRIGGSFPASSVAIFVGHEIGHNLGSPHTHCYNPVVDECYNAESGCFSGTPDCPVGGSGTVMSYCHFGAPNGADCGNSDEEFHPTVINYLDNLMTDSDNFPSCIQPLGSDLIFENGFE